MIKEFIIYFTVQFTTQLIDLTQFWSVGWLFYATCGSLKCFEWRQQISCRLHDVTSRHTRWYSSLSPSLQSQVSIANSLPYFNILIPRMLKLFIIIDSKQLRLSMFPLSFRLHDCVALGLFTVTSVRISHSTVLKLLCRSDNVSGKLFPLNRAQCKWKQMLNDRQVPTLVAQGSLIFRHRLSHWENEGQPQLQE